MTASYRVWEKPGFESSSLVVAWSGDMSEVGAGVADYLKRKLCGRAFADIEPVEFFPLTGVTVENDVAGFPDSRFFACTNAPLVLFVSDPPVFGWYQFLSLILDIAQQQCNVREVYVIGGLVSSSAHSAPRELVGTFSSLEFKAALGPHSIGGDLTYETPPGQRPTLNSFLLWTARRRNMPGACIWVPVPFYLLTGGDPRSEKKVVEFFGQRFGLQMDFSDLDADITHQDEQFAELRKASPDIDGLLNRLEGNLTLSKEENERLVRTVNEAIRRRRK